MATVLVALTVSLDGFIAGADDGPELPLGRGGDRLFHWDFDGDTAIPHYAEAAARGVPGPPFPLSRSSAKGVSELVDRGGAGATGPRASGTPGAPGWGG